jgi:hypothetical protein
MIFRLAKISDIENVLLLQQKYLVTNMPETDKDQGFVTTPFTIDQIKYVIAENSLFVAEADNKIAAYVFVGTWGFFSQWKIFSFMAENLPNLKFENQPLHAAGTFQYGPICIDQDYRGSGVFQHLFETMRENMSARFPVGVTFINKLNKRSFEAHTKKLNLVVIDEFRFNQNEYYTLAFRTDRAIS